MKKIKRALWLKKSKYSVPIRNCASCIKYIFVERRPELLISGLTLVQVDKAAALTTAEVICRSHQRNFARFVWRVNWSC